MAEVRRQEFVVSLADIAAFPNKVLAANEFLYVRQADGKLKMMCGDGVTAVSALPYTIDIGAMEQAVIDAQAAQGRAENALIAGEAQSGTLGSLVDNAKDFTGLNLVGKTVGIVIGDKTYYRDILDATGDTLTFSPLPVAVSAGTIYSVWMEGSVAEAIPIIDADGNFTATEVEGALAELAVGKLSVGSNSDLIQEGTEHLYYTDERVANAPAVQVVVEKTSHNTDQLNHELIGRSYPKPIMTFIDDDGRSEFLTKWVPIIQSKSVSVTVALVTDYVGTAGYMSWEDIETLKALGVEFVSHTHTHEYQNLTETEILEQIELSESLLKTHGCNTSQVLVYPGGYASALGRKLGKKHYRCGVSIDDGTGKINLPPIATFNLQRVSLGRSDNNTLAYYKAKIDTAVASNGWIIWMTHSQFTTFDETQLGYVSEIIDYARASGMQVVNMNDGLNQYGNVLEVGDYIGTASTDYTVIGCDGVMHSVANRRDFIYDNNPEININTPPSYFKENAVTYTSIYGDMATGFPTFGGTLETNIGRSYAYWYQKFYHYDNGDIYRRRWNVDAQAWKDFVKISYTPAEFAADNNLVVKAINYLPETAAITEYEDKKITVFPVNGTQYNGMAGLVTTWRINSKGWSRQELRQHNTNNIYSRYATSTGWSRWEKIGGGKGTTASRPTYALSGYMHYDTTLNKPVWVKTQGEFEKDTLTVSTGATTSGNITITLNGANVLVTVEEGDTVAQVDAKIRAAAFTGWALSGTAGSGVIVFTKNTVEVCSAPSYEDTGVTVAGAFVRTTTGILPIWVDATGTTA